MTEEESPSSSYGLVEGEAVDRTGLNIGLGRESDGLVLNDLALAQGSYLWSAQFYELLVCITYLLGSTGILYGLHIQPYQRPIPYQVLDNSGDYVRNQMFNETFEHETVSFSALCVLALWLPLVIQLALSLCGEHRKNDLHSSVCVYLVAMATSTMATEFVKVYVGYLRPIFYDFCQPDDTYETCTDDDSGDIRKSFVSGHASIAFCGLTLLTLFIHSRFGAASQRYYQRVGGSEEGSRWVRETIQVGIGWARFASLLALLPMGLALFIAASRVRDNKHFPADVVGGSVLGASISIYIHGLWFD